MTRSWLRGFANKLSDRF